MLLRGLLAERGLPGAPHVSVQDNPFSYGTIVEAAPYPSYSYSPAADEVYQGIINYTRYIPGAFHCYNNLPPKTAQPAVS